MSRFGERRFRTFILTATLCGAGASAGCGRGSCDRFGGCPAVDRAATAIDSVVELHDTGSVSVGAGPATTVLLTSGGEAIFSLQVAGCNGTPDIPCEGTLNRLRIRVQDFDLTTSDGHTSSLTDVVVSVTAPVAIENRGAGYLLPAGVVYQTCATVDGHAQSDAASGGPGVLNIDRLTQDFSFDGEFPMALHANDGDCTELQLPTSVQLAGVKPWAQMAGP
jgi:hypothetical protein